MKNCLKSLFLVVNLTVLFISWAQAQNNKNEANNPAALALANSKKAYAENIGFQSRLYNGIKFTDYPVAHYIGNAFWVTSEFQIADLHYDDLDFYDIPILYDIHRDFIVIRQPLDTDKIILINNKLDRFSIGNHQFIRISNNNSEKPIATGFYELLYNGKSQLVKKYVKDILEENNGLRVDYIFKERDTYYLFKDRIYNLVTGERSILKLLRDKKKELEQFIVANQINFKAESQEQAIIKVVAYYDQLNK